jgi:hypothetical protein
MRNLSDAEKRRRPSGEALCGQDMLGSAEGQPSHGRRLVITNVEERPNTSTRTSDRANESQRGGQISPAKVVPPPKTSTPPPPPPASNKQK